MLVNFVSILNCISNKEHLLFIKWDSSLIFFHFGWLLAVNESQTWSHLIASKEDIGLIVKIFRYKAVPQRTQIIESTLQR